MTQLVELMASEGPSPAGRLPCMRVLPPAAASEIVTVVSGLPRSGTSLLMSALDAGGLPALTDGKRARDSRNPHGYFELEAVKADEDYRGWIASARGNAVKVVSRHLWRLPPTQRYDVLFVHRDLRAVLRSQRDMAAHHSGEHWDERSVSELSGIFRLHVAESLAWLRRRPNVRLHELRYEDLLAAPGDVCAGMAAFLTASPLDIPAMAACVDPTLNHARSAPEDRHA